MANLRDRLKRIKETRNNDIKKPNDLTRNGNYKEAYKFILQALEVFGKDSIRYEKLLRRKMRLEKYLHLED